MTTTDPAAAIASWPCLGTGGYGSLRAATPRARVWLTPGGDTITEILQPSPDGPGDRWVRVHDAAATAACLAACTPEGPRHAGQGPHHA